MKRKEVYLLWCVAMLTSVPALAVIPVPLPSMDFEVTPARPGPSESFSIRINGTWPDGCPPYSIDVSVDDGPTMWIDLLLPGVFDPECSPQDCGSESTTWDFFSASEGPFPAGLYDVYVRAIGCDESGNYEPAGFQIRIGPDGNGNGGGQQPGGSLAQGQRVVLLDDDAINGLRAGQAGTVVCCDSADCSGRVLVSWDLWTDARDDAGDCVNQSALAFPAGSATWVDTRAMMLGRPFSQCGTIRRGLEGCIYFEADDGREYSVFGAGDLYVELDTPGGVEFDQRLRLQGLLDMKVPDPDMVRICPLRDGDIYHPVLSACGAVEIGCCGGDLFPGDRVTLRVNNPREPGGTGAPGLMSGATGTVICCGGPYGAGWVFVSWDNWTDGRNADASCDSTIIAYVRDSGWWVPCDQIALSDDNGNGNGNGGDGYIVRVGANALRLRSDPTAPLSQQTLTGEYGALVMPWSIRSPWMNRSGKTCSLG